MWIYNINIGDAANSKDHTENISNTSEVVSQREIVAISYSNDSYYKVEIHEGKRNGQGVHVYANGNIYSGEWVNGKRHVKEQYVI